MAVSRTVAEPSASNCSGNECGKERRNPDRRALAELVARKLIAKATDPKDSREVLVSLTKAGLAAHDAIVAGAQERNRLLLQH